MLCTSKMQLDRRLLAGLCCAGSLVTSHAEAQPAPAALPTASAVTEPTAPPAAATAPEVLPAPPAPPDALETPYSEAPAPPPPPPGRTTFAPPPGKIELNPPGAQTPDTRPQLPIRARRKLALLGEVAWNGLAGFGPVLTYHVDPHFSADFGLGFSLLGWKVGARGRYNFLTSPFTPFVSLGFNYAGGLGQFTTDPSSGANADPNREPVTIDQGPSQLIQGTVGFDFIHRRGFTMLGTLGYAWLLNHDNYRVLAGTLKPDEKQGFDIAFRGGLVLGVAFGYAFESG